MRTVAALALALALAATACASDGGDRASAPTVRLETLSVTSSAFEEGDTIPVRFSCDGENVAPPLAWGDLPDDTRELAIVVTDPDAPNGLFTHWTVWGIDPSVKSIDGRLPEGAVEGRTSSGETGYSGPCPPAGDEPHRYRYEVIALAAPIPLESGATVEEVQDEIESVALSSGVLTGRFGR